VAIDLARGDDTDGDALGARDDRPKELLPLGRGHLLGVVQTRERADAVVPEAGVIEQDAGDDERTGKRAATCFVGAGDVSDAELPVIPKELLAGADSHVARIARTTGDLRVDSAPTSQRA